MQRSSFPGERLLIVSLSGSALLRAQSSWDGERLVQAFSEPLSTFWTVGVIGLANWLQVES